MSCARKHTHKPELSFQLLRTHILGTLFFCHYRETGSTHDVTEQSNNTADREFKRNQAEVVSETQYANKMQKNVQHDQESSPNSSSSSHRQPKRERLNWSVLRPPKGQKRGD